VLQTPELLSDPCPFLNQTEIYCCQDQNAKVMSSNYQALDAVFTSDCPICGVNLKKMWCEYACNKNTSSFLNYTGSKTVGDQTMAKINFKIDSDYACDIYTSCKQVGLIAQAGISSAIAFLDFLGVNGQNQSLSIITFDLTKDVKAPYTLTGNATKC